MPRSVSINYFQCNVVRGEMNRPNLEQAIRSGLAATHPDGVIGRDAQLRRYDGVEDYGVLVINHIEELHQGIFFEAIRFAPGSRIPIIATQHGGTEFALHNADTPPGTDLIRGMLYGIIVGDHFLLLARDLALSKFELYVEWFLSALCRISSADIALRFVPEVNITNLPSVNRMVVRPRDPASPPAAHSTSPGRGGTVSSTGGSEAFEILRAAHFTDSRIAGLQAEGVEIEVRLEVFFKSDGRKESVGRLEIADLIRDIPEDEVTLHSDAGREKAGRIRRISYPAKVETVGDLFDRPSTAAALWDAYGYFRREGYIVN